MLNGGSMVWEFCVYFVYMIPLETDVLRKHRFRKLQRKPGESIAFRCSRVASSLVSDGI